MAPWWERRCRDLDHQPTFRELSIDTIDRMRYTAIVEAQPGGGYHAWCPALTGCHSEGDSPEQSITNLSEAISAFLESLQAHGEPLPLDVVIKSIDVDWRP